MADRRNFIVENTVKAEMKNILIIGAGAIGRGYLPWIFDLNEYQFTFIDKNLEIIEKMNSAKKFKIYRVNNDLYDELDVKVSNAYTPENFKIQVNIDLIWEAVFVCVGPRAVVQIANLLKSIDAPIILCENDPHSVDILKEQLPQNRQVVFAIPDVITSNSAPEFLLKNDQLSVVTERGEIFVDERVSFLKGEMHFISENDLIHKQWAAKLYLHNTPHCIAAYMGALVGAKYVHEAMAVPEVAAIVEGSMNEMLASLKARWDIPHDFLDWYAEKELSRFSCKLLFDPISRVAREPLRKLELDGRLIGAAQICLALGLVPHNILLGITSALLFDNPEDSDNHLSFMHRALGTDSFLSHVLGLRRGEALEKVLSSEMSFLLSQLETLVQYQKTRGSL